MESSPEKRPSPPSRLPSGKKRHIVGVGLDHADGHKRLTKAERFTIVGGSEETHGQMTETLLKTCEDLRRKGRDLDDAAPEEVHDLIRKHAEGTG